MAGSDAIISMRSILRIAFAVERAEAAAGLRLSGPKRRLRNSSRKGPGICAAIERDNAAALMPRLKSA
jgi:hypothetical protein